MRLLLDHNLSPRLIKRLHDVYSDCTHVFSIGLHEVDDSTVWNYALNGGFIIVTKDSDFNELVIQRGYPPKVIWIRRGNCTTWTIEELLRAHAVDISALADDPNSGILVLP